MRQADSQEVEQVDVAIKEMKKERPCRDVLLSLMKSTFGYRRQYILRDEGSVTAKLPKFPALKTPSVVKYVCVSTRLHFSKQYFLSRLNRN